MYQTMEFSDYVVINLPFDICFNGGMVGSAVAS